MVEHLLCKCKVLSSNNSTTKKKKKGVLTLGANRCQSKPLFHCFISMVILDKSLNSLMFSVPHLVLYHTTASAPRVARMK